MKYFYQLFLAFNSTWLIIVVFLVKDKFVFNFLENYSMYLSWGLFILVPILFTALSFLIAKKLPRDQLQASSVIRTWVYDENNHLSHIGEQYIDKFYFEYEIENIKTIIAFQLFADTKHSFAISKAIPLLERMLNEHFGDIIEII